MKRYQCMAIGCPFETDSRGLSRWVENVLNNSFDSAQAGGFCTRPYVIKSILFETVSLNRKQNLQSS